MTNKQLALASTMHPNAKETTTVSLFKQGVGIWGLRSFSSGTEGWDAWLWKYDAENPTSSGIVAYRP